MLHASCCAAILLTRCTEEIASFSKTLVVRSRELQASGCSAAQQASAMRAKKSAIVSMRATISAHLRLKRSNGISSFSSVSTSLSTSDSPLPEVIAETVAGDKPPLVPGAKATVSSSISKYVKPTKPKYQIRENAKFTPSAHDVDLTIKRAKLQIKNAYKAGKARDVMDAYKTVR